MSIFIFDLDKTITKSDTYIPFLLQLLKINKKPLFFFPYLLISIILFFLKLIDNKELKERFLSKFLSGVKIDEIRPIVKMFSNQIIQNGIYLDALKEIKSIIKKGDHLVLASASLDIYVEKIGCLLNFSTIISTKVEM